MAEKPGRCSYAGQAADIVAKLTHNLSTEMLPGRGVGLFRAPPVFGPFDSAQGRPERGSESMGGSFEGIEKTL